MLRKHWIKAGSFWFLSNQWLLIEIRRLNCAFLSDYATSSPSFPFSTRITRVFRVVNARYYQHIVTNLLRSLDRVTVHRLAYPIIRLRLNLKGRSHLFLKSQNRVRRSYISCLKAAHLFPRLFQQISLIINYESFPLTEGTIAKNSRVREILRIEVSYYDERLIIDQLRLLHFSHFTKHAFRCLMKPGLLIDTARHRRDSVIMKHVFLWKNFQNLAREWKKLLDSRLFVSERRRWWRSEVKKKEERRKRSATRTATWTGTRWVPEASHLKGVEGGRQLMPFQEIA